MSDPRGFAVFFFPTALEALGEAIRPYLVEGPGGPHVRCHAVDTAGAFVELTLHGRQADGRDASLELMVPSAMVRLIASVQSEGVIGFGPRAFDAPVPVLPAIGPTAPPAAAPAAGVPGADVVAPSPGAGGEPAEGDGGAAKPGA